jgi:phosphate starvation-inducible PhoH-like protein
MAKVDPYLRPLYDALYDMVEPEGAQRLLERGTVEVAPLAFMRGRAQPVDRRVLTPWGWRRIGELEVGDLVVGSNGEPTPVLGVFPQGRRDVHRVATQDGASTLACAEHLWFVRTLDDAKHGKAGRVLQTQEMVGNLRRHHQRRYELPLVSQPVHFEPQPVPMDPYALGLLLGDGCITTRTTPSFTTTVPGSTLVRERRLAGSTSATKFVPLEYLLNSPAVRLGVLQGLLDTAGGPVDQAERSCRVQYTTRSRQLHDDVVFLVRSLGGVAYSHHRADAHILDIRLPEGIQPFRLMRKATKYRLYGGGRPMRFIDSIEPAGEAETVCIQVAAADSLYVTDDFLVTHNTLNSSFIILDEAQNTTPEQMKMFLTRIGFGSRAVVTGDTTQVDVPGGRSGLTGLERILSGIEGLAFVHLSSRDVVRHRIVQDIVDAYERVGGDPPASSR